MSWVWKWIWVPVWVECTMTETFTFFSIHIYRFSPKDCLNWILNCFFHPFSFLISSACRRSGKNFFLYWIEIQFIFPSNIKTSKSLKNLTSQTVNLFRICEFEKQKFFLSMHEKVQRQKSFFFLKNCFNLLNSNFSLMEFYLEIKERII